MADIILIMSVNPGFGGQKFIQSSLKKVENTRKLIEKSGSHALIEVDGGITLSNAGSLFNAGMNVLVTGTTVFKAENPQQMISSLKKAI
jgi:ribulose-phosphate 3-epimerase